jgi:hypothetical protein
MFPRQHTLTHNNNDDDDDDDDDEHNKTHPSKDNYVMIQFNIYKNEIIKKRHYAPQISVRVYMTYIK